MNKKKFKYLNPLFIRLPGRRLFEKSLGRKDTKENQLCELNDGYTTPEIDTKTNGYDSHINKIFLKTSQELEPMIQKANSMVMELSLILNYKEVLIGGQGEEARRQAAMLSVKRTKNDERKAEILIGLAEIKAESDIVDEMLIHYIERAEGVLHSHISKYWKGVLSASSERLEHFPCVSHKESRGRKVYIENRRKLANMIDEAIKHTGGICYEEEKEAV